MDKHDIQATIDYIIALWHPTPKKFGEVHQTLFVDRIRKLNLSLEQSRAVIGEVFLTVKSFGGPSLDEIYRRFRAIDDSKYRVENTWKPSWATETIPTKSLKDWKDWYTDPEHPERIVGMDESARKYLLAWIERGKLPPIVRAVK